MGVRCTVTPAALEAARRVVGGEPLSSCFSTTLPVTSAEVVEFAGAVDTPCTRSL